MLSLVTPTGEALKISLYKYNDNKGFSILFYSIQTYFCKSSPQCERTSRMEDGSYSNIEGKLTYLSEEIPNK